MAQDVAGAGAATLRSEPEALAFHWANSSGSDRMIATMAAPCLGGLLQSGSGSGCFLSAWLLLSLLLLLPNLQARLQGSHALSKHTIHHN